VVVFAGKYSGDTVIETVEQIAEEFPRWRIIVLQERPPWRIRRWIRTRLRKLVREPISTAMDLGVRILQVTRRTPARRRGGPGHLPESLARIERPNVEYVPCATLHGAESVKLIREWKPWLGISLAAPILKRKLFGIPELGTINVHKSLLPDYRGMPPGFWEIHDGVPRSGVSVHWVEESLDTGPIITQQAVTIPTYSTPDGLAAELDLLGIDTLVEALHQIDAGTATSRPQPPTSCPTRGQPPRWLAWKTRRHARHRRITNSGLASTMAFSGKFLIFLFYVYIYSSLRNIWRGFRGRCHTSILLYHRVNDNYRDVVTVGVEQFERHLRLLARRHEVLDLPAFLASRGKPRRRPAVVITFDDGYEDNLLAAMLLRRDGLPATFFLSTLIVGKEEAFRHDLRAVGRRVPTLSWDQVRQMARWGFQFGNHTCHHVDLGATTLDHALGEIADARQDLTRELGESETAHYLASPFGREGNMTDHVRSRLPELGIRSCLSAYGGTNPPDFDPMNILRQGVHWEFSDLRLLAAVEGWRA
jgi:peptidoglycan/xylan/chitin deacetylase (PgdA/CDA1 family)